MLKIGLLSAKGAPMLGQQIASLIDYKVHIDALVLDKKEPRQRDLEIYQDRTGGKMPPMDLNNFGRDQFSVYCVENHNDAETINIVRELGLDILVNAGTPRILKRPILDAPHMGVLNCHPGLLPEFRGCTCVEWALYLDEQVGNTIHWMSEGIDEGPILKKRAPNFFKNGYIC